MSFLLLGSGVSGTGSLPCFVLKMLMSLHPVVKRADSPGKQAENLWWLLLINHLQAARS